MVAWRARIGLIKPTHRGKSFAYWYNHAPEGVESSRRSLAFGARSEKVFLKVSKRLKRWPCN